jgi:hypothetical protein
VEGYITELDTHFSPRASAFIKRFMKFFSELAWSVKENENCYYILNALFYAIRYYYAEERNTAIPGIIYPSGMTDGRGLNIVLVPQAVDRFLRLRQVYMQRFILNRRSKTYKSEPCSELITLRGKTFRFKNVKPYYSNGRFVTYNIK